MTVQTIFAGSADADILSSDASFTNAVNGTGSLAVPVSSVNELWVGQFLFGNYSCYQSFVNFDLSTIAPGQTVTATALQTYLVTDGSTSGDFYCIAQLYDWGASVTTADWQDPTEAQALGAWWTTLHTNGIGATGAYKTWSDGDGFRALCTLFAGSELNLILSSEMNWAPFDGAGTYYMVFANTNVGGTTQDPKLTLTHNRVAVDHIPTGGLVLGSDTDISTIPLIAAIPNGGAVIGSSTEVVFVHGRQTASDIVVEWDLDGDGDFDGPYEDITSRVLSLETKAGRESPSGLEHAGAGKLQMTLRNDDDAFSPTNAASPLNTAPNSLRTGRKIRVRTAEAVAADPVLLARDRFNRADAGSLGVAETGQAWVAQQGGYVIANEVAAALDVPEIFLVETVDVGQGACYVQATLRQLPTINRRIGVVAKFTDMSNYIGVYQDSNPALGLVVRQVVAGASSVVASYPIQPWEGMTIGLLLTATQAAGYISGVQVTALTTHGAVGSGTHAGLYCWFTQTSGREPEIDDFHVWDTVATETEGVLWTGQVDDVNPDLTAGPRKSATVTGVGVLANLTRPKIAPPRLPRAGAPTGMLVGDVLSRVGALHPPALIDPGAVTTGCVAMNDGKAIELAREFEKVERGTLYETNEGQVGFADSDRRATAAVSAVFSDAPGAQLGYTALPLLDEQSSIVNHVTAHISPDPPSDPTWTIRTGGHATAVDVVLPTTAAGDLLFVFIANSVDAGVEWLTPIWWANHRDLKAAYGLRVYSHFCDGTESGDTINFYDYPGTPAGLWTAFIARIPNWFESYEGIAVSAFAPGNEGPAVLHGWGREPTLFIACQAGVGSISGSSRDVNVDPPDGYYDQQGVWYSSGALQYDIGLTVAHKIDGTEVERPSNWPALAGFITLETVTVAVRGYNGEHTKATLDNPRTTGGDGRQQVVENVDSQDEHGALLTYETARLFADDTDALAYGLLTIAANGDNRTTCQLTFFATKSVHYRAQAIARRVGHKIRVVAENNAGYGLDGYFFIESVSHRFEQGTSLWECTWELSPA